MAVRALVAVVALLALLAGAAVYLGNQVLKGIETFDDPFAALPERAPRSTPANPDAPHDPVNILLLGSDSRTSGGHPSSWQPGGQRTDTIMILHLPGDRTGADVVSIPRETWVSIPGHGENTINAAYALGGPSLMVQTVEELTDVWIDHVAAVDFQSFAELTDAMGGVEITVPEDSYSHGTLVTSAGTHVMDGREALAYVSQNNGLPRGDLDRIPRQQAWIRAMAAKVASSSMLSHPVDLYRTLRGTASSLAVDEGFGVVEMVLLAWSGRHIAPEEVRFLTVPLSAPSPNPDGTQIRRPAPRMAELTAAMATDRMGEYADP